MREAGDNVMADQDAEAALELLRGLSEGPAHLDTALAELLTDPGASAPDILLALMRDAN